MNLHVGTSGYSYKEWKGSFYPEKLPAKDMLSYYASRLPAVELNNTFYRLPQKSMVENWKEQVPANFRFSIKAPQRITHFKRLKEVEEETKVLLETVLALEDRLGHTLDPDRDRRGRRIGGGRRRRAGDGNCEDREGPVTGVHVD